MSRTLFDDVLSIKQPLCLPPDQFATYFRTQYDGFVQVVREYNVKFD